MIYSIAELDVQESEARIAKLKSDRDAVLTTPGQEKRCADLNEALMLEERLLEQRKHFAQPKGPDPRRGSLEEDEPALPARE